MAAASTSSSAWWLILTGTGTLSLAILKPIFSLVSWLSSHRWIGRDLEWLAMPPTCQQAEGAKEASVPSHLALQLWGNSRAASSADVPTFPAFWTPQYIVTLSLFLLVST